MAGDRHFENSFFLHILAVHYPISNTFGMQFQWTYENSKYYIEKLHTVYLNLYKPVL